MVALEVVAVTALAALLVVMMRRRRAVAAPPKPDRRPPVERTADPGPADDLRDAAPERINEELFWYRLLSPVLGLPGAERERTLRSLASRAHTHPTKGRRIFAVATLRERLAHVRQIDRAALLARAEALDKRQGPPVTTL